jgi:riboflavin kinase / FMN adenylyltransferase
MDVVAGVDGLQTEHGPVFAVVGVFDGLHRGHLYLLDHLEREAAARGARATVITFDHHPDEVITGTAPPLLMDPQERIERLAAAGVDVTVVQHFDDAVRRTTYDAFVERIRAHAGLTGFLMTPDAAFGYERRGTPETLAALGTVDGFDVVVVPPFTLDGRSVRSADIRAAIAAGDLAAAELLLGRPVMIAATAGAAIDGLEAPLAFAWPMALPPDGRYRGVVAGSPATLTIARGEATVAGVRLVPGRVEITLAS